MRLLVIALCFALLIGLVLTVCTFFNPSFSAPHYSSWSTPAPENLQAAENPDVVGGVFNDDPHRGEESVIQVVVRALAADDFFGADSKPELRTILERTYAGPLLDKLTDAVWEARNTDNCGGARVTEWLAISVNGETAVVKASVEALDWASGRYDYGTALFTLTYTVAGWRIVQADYHWAENDPGIFSDTGT